MKEDHKYNKHTEHIDTHEAVFAKQHIELIEKNKYGFLELEIYTPFNNVLTIKIS